MANQISVIVPVYNVADALPRCLDSILAQQYSEIEIIAVDDGSTDESGIVLDMYAKMYHNIRAIHVDNGGVTSARLRGVKEASGDWIGFVDGDDEIEPEMYEMLMRNAIEHDAEISHCGYQMRFPDGRIRYFYNTRCKKIESGTEATKELLAGVFEPGLCNKLFYRPLLTRFLSQQMMDTTIKNNEDLLMNYYLFCKSRVTVFEDICPYHYLVRYNSASRRALNTNRIWDPIRVREIILSDCDNSLKGEAEKALLISCIYTYCGLTLSRKHKADQEEIRRIIMDHKNAVNGLPKRTRILASYIIFARGLVEVLYPVYSRYFQVKKYE